MRETIQCRVEEAFSMDIAPKQLIPSTDIPNPI